MLGEQPQQLGLTRQRQLLDVIEYQGASLRARYPSRRRALRSGEGAGLEAEELALEESRRKRSDVDLDEAGNGAAARAVDGAREAATPDPAAPSIRTGASAGAARSIWSKSGRRLGAAAR